MGDPRYTYVNNLHQEFGNFILKSSRFLRDKGPENTFSSSQILLRSMRTFMLDYGDSRDNYYTLRDRYEAEYNLALQYVGQKVWPRALYVRKARYVLHECTICVKLIPCIRYEGFTTLRDYIGIASNGFVALFRTVSSTRFSNGMYCEPHLRTLKC